MKPIIGITADMDENIYKLKQDYVSAVEKSGGLPLILVPAMDNVSQIADFIDGLLLPGGNDISPEYYGEKISVPSGCLKIVRKERSDFEIALLKEVVKRKKPVLAICYGMQLVNAAFGGSLYQDIETQVKGAINHREGQHDIKIIQSLAFSPQPSVFTVNSSHHQAVKALADGFEVFAVSEDGIIEGFYKKNYPFFICVQWHPERSFQGQGPSNSSEDKSLPPEKGIGVKPQSYDKLSIDILKAFVKTAGRYEGQ